MNGTGNPERTGGLPKVPLNVQHGSGHLRLTYDIPERLKLIETESNAVVPGIGLIFERSREGRHEERTLLADILPVVAVMFPQTPANTL